MASKSEVSKRGWKSKKRSANSGAASGRGRLMNQDARSQQFAAGRDRNVPISQNRKKCRVNPGRDDDQTGKQARQSVGGVQMSRRGGAALFDNKMMDGQVRISMCVLCGGSPSPRFLVECQDRGGRQSQQDREGRCQLDVVWIRHDGRPSARDLASPWLMNGGEVLIYLKLGVLRAADAGALFHCRCCDCDLHAFDSNYGSMRYKTSGVPYSAMCVGFSLVVPSKHM